MSAGFEDFPDMQLLSHVKANAVTIWGEAETMTLRPALAAKVARCIALWSEIEVHLGRTFCLMLTLF
jgi:hypothetical protein